MTRAAVMRAAVKRAAVMWSAGCRRQRLVIAAALPVTAATGCGESNIALLPKVPQSLAAPSNETLVHVLRAEGVQIYACKPDAAGHYAWTFVEPQANLYDHAGKQVGRHFAGPTWAADDGSAATGTMVAHEDSPDPKSIPWLRITTTTSGDGYFSGTRTIQRLYTVGGKAPAGGCGVATAGSPARVPYTAAYYFYVARR